MNTPSDRVNPPVQLPLLPPEVLELHLRVGVVMSSDHCQFQTEAWDASGGVLIGMQSRPHVHAAQALRVFDEEVAKMRDLLREAINPF